MSSAEPVFSLFDPVNTRSVHELPGDLLAGTLLVTPTYDEAANIGRHVRAVFRSLSGASLLVVDDDSPDRTWEAAESLRAEFPRLFVMRRRTDHGFRQSYRDGFLWAIEKGFERVIMMDADGSHPAEFLPALLDACREHDFVVGSRYGGGIRVLNWAPGRLLLSIAGNRYARFWTGVPCADLTAGFNCIRTELLCRIDPRSLRYNGYAIQIELKFRAYRLGARMIETPIVFLERRAGRSKLSRSRVVEGLWCPIRLRFSRRSVWRPEPGEEGA